MREAALRGRGRRSRLLGILTVALLWSTSASVRAETVTLTPQIDTTLYEDNKAWSNGAGTYLFVGNNNKALARRALLKFELRSAIPVGSKIVSAELSLFATRGNTGTTAASAHRLLAAWSEGSSNAPANEGGGATAGEGDATWTYRSFPAGRWNHEGGDFESAASASVVLTALGPAVFADDGLRADVQHWLERPEQNFGWILLASDPAQDLSKRFGSRSAARFQRPRLTVTFTPPQAAIGVCCAADGSCGYALDPGAACMGAYQSTVQVCAEKTCPAPKAACCRPDESAQCSVADEASCRAGGGVFHEGSADCTGDPCPVVLKPFVDPLPRLPVAVPQGSDARGTSYRMAIVQLSQKLHRDLPPTRVWGFDDGHSGARFPGPSFELQRGEPIRVTWSNELRDESGAGLTAHPLPLGPCASDAERGPPKVVIHLHGGHVPSDSSGLPDQAIAPGAEVTYTYPNQQDAATLWYHDQTLGLSRLNMAMGLAGFYILRDPTEQTRSLPSGEYDVPLLVQDRSFYADGRLKYLESVGEHVFGDTVLVNGKAWPYLDVVRGRYRLRLLNAANSRTFTFYFEPTLTFVQIASDGGLLRSGVAKSELTLGPGERAEIVVDFATGASEYALKNKAQAPYPSGDEHYALSPVMKFLVSSATGYRERPAVELQKIDAVNAAAAQVMRDLSLARSAEGCGGGTWLIGERRYAELTERPRLDTPELWRFINRSGVAHPIHLPLNFFRALDRQRIEIDGDRNVPTGDLKAVESGEAGWKDTIQVGPFEILRALVQFRDYAGRYSYQCQILEHADHEMIRQLETLPACALASCESDAGVPGDDAGAPASTADAAMAEPPPAGGAGANKPSGGCNVASGAPLDAALLLVLLVLCTHLRLTSRSRSHARLVTQAHQSKQ